MRLTRRKNATTFSNRNISETGPDCKTRGEGQGKKDREGTWSHFGLMIPMREENNSSGNNKVAKYCRTTCSCAPQSTCSGAH